MKRKASKSTKSPVACAGVVARTILTLPPACQRIDLNWCLDRIAPPVCRFEASPGRTPPGMKSRTAIRFAKAHAIPKDKGRANRQRHTNCKAGHTPPMPPPDHTNRGPRIIGTAIVLTIDGCSPSIGIVPLAVSQCARNDISIGVGVDRKFSKPTLPSNLNRGVRMPPCSTTSQTNRNLLFFQPSSARPLKSMNPALHMRQRKSRLRRPMWRWATTPTNTIVVARPEGRSKFNKSLNCTHPSKSESDGKPTTQVWLWSSKPYPRHKNWKAVDMAFALRPKRKPQQ